MRFTTSFLLLSMMMTAMGQTTKKPTTLYIGTYTGEKSKGIYMAKFDSETGKLSEPELAAETESPSFLAFHPSKPWVYAVNEVDSFKGEKAGSVTAFAIDPASGKLKQLNQVSTKGGGPCHVALDQTGKVCVVANYGQGNIASYQVGADGKLSEPVSVIQHEGRGINRSRQEHSHAHQIVFSPENKLVIAVDLGADRFYYYNVDLATGKLAVHEPPFVTSAPGAGPRHLAFAPNQRHAYSINELNNTVMFFRWLGLPQGLTPMMSLSTLPNGFEGENSTAEIEVHPNGKYLYGSNRGHDSIALFELPNTGVPKYVNTYTSGGKEPRHFTIDPSGKWMIVANQSTDNIVVYAIDKNTGALKPTGNQISVGKPVCVLLH